MTTKHVDLTLGLILLRDGKLSKDQLKKALLKQGEIRRFGKVVRLGEVIVKLGLLSEAEVAAALGLQEALVVPMSSQTALGLLLIDAGLLTPSQIFEALVEQQAGEKRLGEVVVAKGWLAASQLEPFLAKQAEQRRAHEAAHPAVATADEDPFVIFDMGGSDRDLAPAESHGTIAQG